MAKQIFVILLLFCSINAQQKQDQKTLFYKAVDMFRFEQYEQAYKIFLPLSSDKAFQIPAKIFVGKILLKQGNTDEAQKIFDDLEENVKDTLYRREVILNKAVIQYKKQNYYEAAVRLLELIKISGNSGYYTYAKNSLDTIAVNNLSPVQIETFIDKYGNELKPLLLLLLGKSCLAVNDRQRAKAAFLKIMQQHSSSALRKEAEDYFYERKSVDIFKQTKPVIALVFPEGNSSSVKEILEGIKYAVHEFNSVRDEKIGLVRINLTDDIKPLKDKVLSMDTKCILGPVFSGDVRNVISELNGVKIPIISPTATDDDLTGLNEYFFQANPNFTTRAKAIAQYVYYVENKRRMGVLNASGGYSMFLAEVFIEEYKKLGGEVLVNPTFKSRSGNFNEAVSAINGISDLEGLYIPVADKDDITPLLTAFSKNNITLPIYGNQDWFLGRGYQSFPGLSNNLIFESDYYIDYNNYDYSSFSEKFSRITGMDAERNVLYGYDITKYFLNQVTKINSGADIIAARMVNDNTTIGYHSNICFDEDRVNKFVNIIRYRDGIFELVDKFKTKL